ncbi:flagellar protein FlaG [Imhoffiella purpurea]|uniref:flagellar protein FlaG n=1 Tax=Imhoffiella purpurea TaxID=1249627 RepID=UPI0006934B57|nr:flagellar protein FlaG [Imhoffiella purpurea]
MSDAKPSLGLASANGGPVSAKTGGEAYVKGVVAGGNQVVVESIDSFLQDEKRTLEFCLDEDQGCVLVRVLDWERRTLIRQIPFAQAVRLMAEFYERVTDRAKPR